MKKILYQICLGILLIPLAVSAQETKPLINSKLVGNIIDQKSKEPLVGATVQIKGTTHAVTTDVNGKFYFQTGQKFPYTLVISFIGFKTKEEIVNEEAVTIQLEEDQKLLNEVVVIGYGQLLKKDVTGSIESVNSQSIKAVQTSLDRALQGTVAGVNVTQTSGQPGGGISVRVRGGSSIQGGNEPLYVVDGFPIYNSDQNAGVASGSNSNPLASINPSDIESITVLKDASSTAIYGSRGANGVVIITTKKGKTNENRVSYDVSYGVQKLNKKLDLLDAKGFARLRNDALFDSAPAKGKNQYLSEEQINALGAGTDWQDETFRSAKTQNHQLSISGGSQRTRYAISGNYFNQDGIIKNTDFNRYSARINLDTDINSKVRFGLNLTGTKTTADLAPTGLVSAIISMPATATVFDANGNYTLRNPFENIFSNPIAALNKRINNSNAYRVLATTYGEYDIIDDLVLKVSFGTDIQNNRENSYLPTSIFEGLALNGEARIGYFNSSSWLNENTLTYSKAIQNKHFFNILAGYTQQRNTREIVSTGSQNFVTDALTYNALQSGNTPLTPVSSSNTWALNSYLGRVNYNFEGKYFATASIRSDGSSRFGVNNKWGYFPSAALAWQVSKENFFSPLSAAINSLKIRASYGSTGNQEIGEYQSLSTLESVKYIFGDQIVTGFRPSRIANSFLGWEQTNQFDGGLDLGILKNRLFLTLDLYQKITSNLLLDVQIPYTSGHTSSLQNFGSVRNRGIEVGANTQLGSGAFSWSSNFNIAFNKNEVIQIGNGASFYTFGNYIVKVGEPLGSFYGAVTDGVLQKADIETKGKLTGNAVPKAGDRLYRDINGDGAFTTAADRTTIGTAQPKFTGGFNNTFNYKGFELNVLFQGSYGNKILNGNGQSLELFNGQQNASIAALDRWTETNPSTTIPRAKLDPAPVFSDRYVEDGSFLRAKNVSLTYSLPKPLLVKAKIEAVRIRLSGQNLWTLTNYTGFDPEVTNGSSISPGTDSGIYPTSKTYSLGLNLTF
ncbi:SusC/RagA family TonB-linked outer membrane protein [Lacihabitans soyangensis]|uniref:TonB-dependent receptor n=1 Tax=Lacihabitans soyangensis TaxID=869394 RepID=A0AAE3H637_9BACT|nr:TonB-dependent receptor [Lacihabitans soyangensis]MCP9765438.1 TonB-dependent receptor [Lacihabitans soyangensis]